MGGFGPFGGMALTLALQIRPGDLGPGSGQPFTGQVVSRPEGLAIQSSHGTFPLPADSGLAPGLRVRIEAAVQQGKAVIRVTPLSPSTPAPPGAPAGAPAAPLPSAAPSPASSLSPPPGASAPLHQAGGLPPAEGPPPARPFHAPQPPAMAPRPLPPASSNQGAAVPPAAPGQAVAPPGSAGATVSTASAPAGAPAAAPSPPPAPASAPQPMPQAAPAPVPPGAAAPQAPAAPSGIAPAGMTAAPVSGALPNSAVPGAWAAVLVPRAALAFPAAASRVMNAVAAPAAWSDDLGGLVRLLAQVFGRSGSTEASGGLGPWLLPNDLGDAEAVAASVKRQVESGLRTAESAMAREGAPARAPSSAESLRAAVTQLLHDEALSTALRDEGLIESFSRSAERVLERAVGGQLQNLRAIDGPYLFAALPSLPESGLRHAQLHIFGDGGGRRGEPDAIQVHLDLDLTALGPLWVSLSLYGGHCQCTLRSASEEICALLDGHRAELEAALQAAGYEDARCVAAPWHGDRLRELAETLQAGAPGWRAEA